jgi:hypothetical protein
VTRKDRFGYELWAEKLAKNKEEPLISAAPLVNSICET